MLQLRLSTSILHHIYVLSVYLQVEKALDRDIYAAAWNCQASEQQRSSIVSEITSSEPEIKLLYTTPESLKTERLRGALKVTIVVEYCLEKSTHGSFCHPHRRLMCLGRCCPSLWMRLTV